MARPVKQDFLVSPLEPVLFGKPQPFNAGEGHFARSQFPPSPQTFQGLVRSHLLRATDLDLNDWSVKSKQEWRELVGDSDALPDGWQLHGPFPCELTRSADDESEVVLPWLPIPRCVYFAAENPRENARQPLKAQLLSSSLLTLDDQHAALANDDQAPSFVPGPGDGVLSKAKTGWLSANNLLWVLGGKAQWRSQECSLAHFPGFVKAQLQTGIALDQAKRTTKDGMLYSLENLRFADNAGFWAAFEGELADGIPSGALHTGLSSAGRKGRLLAFEPAPVSAKAWQSLRYGEHLPAEVTEQDYFWLYLLTPARLQTEPSEGGEHLCKSLMLHTNLEAGVQLEADFLLSGKSLVIGGWDLANGRMRSNRAFVPAGSCVLFRLTGGSADSRVKSLHTLNFSHCLGDQKEAGFGFGQVLVGIGPQLPATQNQQGN